MIGVMICVPVLTLDGRAAKFVTHIKKCSPGWMIPSPVPLFATILEVIKSNWCDVCVSVCHIIAITLNDV